MIKPPELLKNSISYSAQMALLKSCFTQGKTKPLHYREKQLNGLKTFLQNHEADIEKALYLDMGRPALEAYTADIAITAAEISYIQKNLRHWIKPKKVWTTLAAFPGKSRIYSEAYGVVLIIAPWNYPLQLSLSPLAGAIAAGNCAIIKPSEYAPETSALLARQLPKYIDEECFQIIEGGITETTALLQESFDYIFYTGNPSVGRIVMQAAAKHLTPITLELGGKSPCIVDSETNIDLASKRILFGKFFNAGQTCIAPDYVLVHKKVEEKLLASMKKTLIQFYGENPKLSKDFGRIINEKHCHRLKNLLNANGEIYHGGEIDITQKYISPTLLRNLPETSSILSEEIFGPILPVISIENIDDAIKYVNKRPKPLALYLFSNNKKIQDKIIASTSSGGVCINHTTLHYLVNGLPFGGVGTSGMGSYHGKTSFETFSHKKSVLFKPNGFDIPIIYPPHGNNKKKWLRWLL